MLNIIGTIKKIGDRVLAIESPTPIQIDESKKYKIDIAEYRSKRSLEQNSYMWALLTEIDKKINGGRADDPVKIYIQCLERAHAKSNFYLCVEDGLDMLKRQFRATREIGNVTINGINYVNVECFWGSSHMNTKEMTDLIDIVLDYASEVDIYTPYWEGLLK